MRKACERALEHKKWPQSHRATDGARERITEKPFHSLPCGCGAAVADHRFEYRFIRFGVKPRVEITRKQQSEIKIIEMNTESKPDKSSFSTIEISFANQAHLRHELRATLNAIIG